MASTKEIKRRIKSVKNTKKITKAMELVAASKMKRAVSSTLASRVYSKYSLEILESLSEAITESVNLLFVEKPKQKTLFLLVTSNRGLCGAYNAQVIRQTMKFIKESSTPIDFVAVGKKGDAALRRIGQNIVASFTEIPDAIHLRDILPIATILFDEFGKGTYDHVYVAYTDFVSALTQTPKIRQLLPISKQALLAGLKGEVEERKKNTGYTFEPSYETLIEKLVEKLSRMQVYQMLLESMASEQSSRMVAMKNASEAAGEMIDDLTLIFNKARQSSITQEISEISAGMASVS